jgi:RNA-splicing ligase RtcB
MYTVKGACAEALITIDDLDSEALTQLYGLLNAKAAEGSHVAIMPDVHPGKDCLVGFTQKFLGDADVRLVPNFVGGDIACGVFAWPIGRKTPDLNALDNFIKRHIPNGSRGYAIVNDASIVKLVLDGETLVDKEMKTDIGTASDPGKMSADKHALQIRNFIDAIRGEAELISTSYNGYTAVKFIEDIYNFK